MGLDLFEFTLAVEDTFCVAISDADAAGILTPGQLVDYLQIRIPADAEPVCTTQRAFYRVRAAASHVLGTAPRRVEPTTRWNTLLPFRRRRQAWHLLHRAVGTPNWPQRMPWNTMETATVGGTARYLAVSSPMSFTQPGGGLPRRAIERTVAALMARHLAVSEFRWDQRFVRDLGCS